MTKKTSLTASPDIHWSWDMPDVSGSCVVVSDVLAATSNIAWFFTSGVSSVILAGNDTVQDLHERYPDAAVVGESTVLPKGFFTVSNHPADVFTHDWRGRDVIYISNNGTRVIGQAFAGGALQVLAVSFLNIGAVAAWLGQRPQERVVHIASGELSYDDRHAPEDRICQETLQQLIAGMQIGWKQLFSGLRNRMLAYYDRGFDASDLPYILQHDTVRAIPGFSQDRDGTITGIVL